MTFSLFATLRQIHDETDLTDHRQVAKELRTRIPDEDLEEVLLVALTEYVRMRFADQRRDIYHETSSAQKPGTKSWKRDGIREWWQAKIHCRYDTADGQRLLRDFTADDCEFQIGLLREQIEASQGKMQQWSELKSLLELNGTDTVGDLPW